MEDLIGIALRISVTYWYVLLLLRLSGKRSVDSLAPQDFMVALIIGDMFDDTIWAEVPLAKGVVGMSTILLLHTLVAFASWKSKRVEQLVSSAPTRVVQNGKMVPDGLRHERTRAGEVEMSMRLLGEDKLDEIKEACWEPGGDLSVQKKEPAKPVQKRDLAALRKAV